MAFTCTIPAVPTVQQDDSEVRITRWDFPPGAVTGQHTHGWPYVIVMLTDGVGNLGKSGGSCDISCSVAAAEYCRSNNVTVYTIGFGSDVNDQELTDIALLTHGDYYFAPNVQTLTAIFQSIGKH